MSSYAVTDDGALIVCWWAGFGGAARVVTHSPDSRIDLLHELVGELTRLSEECWRVYVEPVTSDPIAGEVDRRLDLTGLASIIDNPTLPTADGLIFASYIPVVEFAHRVGRICHHIDDPQLTASVSADVEAEVAAVLSADRGDLGGRGRQAARLSRLEASPAQVAAAWQALADDPLDGSALLTDFDPAAASVAAAAWLAAAGEFVAEQLGQSAAIDVIRFADDLEAVPVRTLTLVFDMLEDHDPYSVVTHLVGEAKTVAAGRVPNVDQLEQAIHEARTLAERIARREADIDEMLGDVRLCVLDPRRPAPDLLEDLLTGIYACWLVWREESDQPIELGEDDELDDECDDPEEEAARRRRFCDELRARVSDPH